jgi:RNA polymerase sigma-70 factor (ECF subfamily)
MTGVLLGVPEILPGTLVKGDGLTRPAQSAAAQRRQGEDPEAAGLVARAKTGDVAAFETLVRRYRNDVYALAYHFVGNREDAWDISQETFAKAYGALKRFRREASFKAWLLRIAANQCKDFFKKRRIKTVSLDGRILRDAAPGPAKQAEAEELGMAIRAALAALPDKQRRAFVLREFENMSYAEMAQVMACSTGTVMSRLHHARKKLQAMLVGMGVVEGNRND